jgi:hypothetical protein
LLPATLQVERITIDHIRAASIEVQFRILAPLSTSGAGSLSAAATLSTLLSKLQTGQLIVMGMQVSGFVVVDEPEGWNAPEPEPTYTPPPNLDDGMTMVLLVIGSSCLVMSGVGGGVAWSRARAHARKIEAAKYEEDEKDQSYYGSEYESDGQGGRTPKHSREPEKTAEQVAREERQETKRRMMVSAGELYNSRELRIVVITCLCAPDDFLHWVMYVCMTLY